MGKAVRSIKPFSVFLALVLVFFCAVNDAPAEDLDITISADVLERLFQAAQPIRFKSDVLPGQTATVTLTNPHLILEPGDPGRVFVELDYEAKTKGLLALEPITGRAKPEGRFRFEPKQGTMKVTLHNVMIKGIPVSALIEPFYLPLTSTEPIKLQEKLIRMEASAARTEVTEKGLRILLNSQFTPEPLPQ